MTARALIRLLLAALGALALLAPAVGVAAEPGSTTSGETTTIEVKPLERTSSTPAPGATSTPAPTTTGQSTQPPAPSGSGPEVSTTPQVQAQQSQGSTPGAPTARARTKSKGAHRGAPSAPTGGSAAAPRAGRRAPSPSALTPPLPLAFSASLSGVPSFFIESFRIPPFLLPIYQAAGTAYGVPWQVLAAINEVETDYGRDLSVSSAGAEGWMQFLPSSWATYGVDANGDGFKDPYNPADAIFAAARYLRAAGAATSLRGAILAYNHSQAYVESVMLRAKLLGGTPSELLGAITGLTEARFPVHAQSHFSDGFPPAPASGSGAPKTIVGTTIYSAPGAPVIAVQDGQIVQVGDSRELGHFVSLRDAYGNTYTYAQLGSVAALYPVLKPHDSAAAKVTAPRSGEATEPRPSGPATAGSKPSVASSAGEASAISGLSLEGTPGLASGASAPTVSTSTAPAPAPAPAPTVTAPAGSAIGSPPPPTASGTPSVFRAGPNDVYLHPLRRGVAVIAGTVLGHVAGQGASAGSSGGEPHVLFQIRPAGVGAPLIDPKPILDGWVQLENSSIFRANGANPFLTSAPTPGQVLLESKQQLEQQVLANPGIDIYECGRQDIQTGQIDRRVLVTLEFLEVSGLKPTVSALKCGHSDLTTPATAAERSSGDALDISRINGTPILGHQGPGSITDRTIRKLLTLQGSMKPQEIISLMRYPGIDNTLAMADQASQIHVGFKPPSRPSAALAGAFSSAITPSEWIKLIARLGEIPNPVVASGPSAASIPDHPGAATPSGREPGGHN
jgi:murein DD-endopeptidase MepM/ murein hydrolase activator NlpD